MIQIILKRLGFFSQFMEPIRKKKVRLSRAEASWQTWLSFMIERAKAGKKSLKAQITSISLFIHSSIYNLQDPVLFNRIFQSINASPSHLIELDVLRKKRRVS